MTAIRFCDRENAVIRAARSNNWDEETRSHAASCPDCRETVKILTAMVSLESSISDVPSAPDPRLIWLKASFARRQKRNALVARVAVCAYAVLGAALGAGVFWFLRTNQATTSTVSRSFHPGAQLAAPFLVPVLLIIVLLFVFSPGGRRSPS